jgi:hypothetical protein
MAQKADDNHTSSGQPTRSDADKVQPARAEVRTIPLQQLVRPVAALPLHQFISLNDALAQVRGRVGAGDLAAHDLWQHARERRLTIAARQVWRGQEQAFILRSAFWQYFTIDAYRPWVYDSSETARSSPDDRLEVARVWRGRGAPSWVGTWYFFVARKRFERLYSAAAQAPTPSILSAPNPRGAGTKQKFNREFILIEAAVYVMETDLPSGLEELVHALQSKLGNKMPKDTQGKEILGPFFRRMKQALGR